MQAQVVVQAGAAEVGIELTLSCARAGERPAGDPAAARAALDELASALGATAQADIGDQRWRARILLPRPASEQSVKKEMTYASKTDI